jgi:replicative DNA helicase
MIKPLEQIAEQAVKKLSRYQSGKLKPVVTGREFLDETFGGLLPGDITVICGASGAGKSHELQEIRNTVMNPEVNPESEEYVWLDYSFEMRFLSTFIREASQRLGKSKKKVLTEGFSEEEREVIRTYYESLISSNRFFMEEEVITPEEFRLGLLSFLEANKNKKAVFVAIDHMALFKGAVDKKNALDLVVEIVNEARKIYPNTIWFFLSQLNRNILGRLQEKNINAMPNRGDVYQSDTMFFIADYLYVQHNPYALGIKLFSKVNVSQYDYIEKKHFGEIKNGKGSFDTLGKIFSIVLKNREAGVVYKNIFIKEIDIPERDKYVDTSFADEFNFDNFDDFETPKLTALNKHKGGDF